MARPLPIAVLFPGQGSQKVGMGRDLMPRYASSLFSLAKETLGPSFLRLCWEGPEEELRRTLNAQPALFLCALSAWYALEKRFPFTPRAFAGHSLGEYTAFTAGGSFTPERGLQLVLQRAQLMESATQTSPGAMVALLGIGVEPIKRLCEEDPGIVTIANINAPDQVVLSGEKEAVERVAQKAREEGARRIVPLAVSGAFHSPLMSSAGAEMRKVLQSTPIQQPTVPVIANYTGEVVRETEEVLFVLSHQMTGTVRWVDCVQTLDRMGVELYIECGPGKVLSNLVRRILPKAQTLNVEDSDSLESTLKFLEENYSLGG